MSAPQIRSRKPTGQVPWPLLLLEGPEKAGKSLLPVVLSRSERVGMFYWIDLGEGAADEYAALPGSQYQVIEHDGSYRDILEQITAVYLEAKRAAEANEPPVGIVVDSMSAEWTMLVNWTSHRARRSKNGQRKLQADPDAEIDPTSNLWNDANKRHARIMDLLMTFPGIAIVTARGKEVAVIGPNGQPVEGQKTWKVEGQKNLAYDASAWIRLQRDPRTAELMGVRSLRVQVPDGEPFPMPMTKVGSWDVCDLEAFIFDTLGCSVNTQVRDLKKLSGDELEGRLQQVTDAGTPDEVRAVWEDTTGKLRPEDWETFKTFALGRVEEIKAATSEPVDDEPEVPEQNFGDAPPADDVEKIRTAAKKTPAKKAAVRA